MKTAIDVDTAPARNPIEEVARPIREDFRTAPVEESFDWPAIFDAADVTVGTRYLVVFRSKRRSDAPDELITALDFAAYTEAAFSPDLDHYGASEPDAERQAVSWCMWTDQASARAALSGPAHSLAASLPRDFYDQFDIELYNVHRTPDGQIEFETVPHHMPEAPPEPREIRQDWTEVWQLVHKIMDELTVLDYSVS